MNPIVLICKSEGRLDDGFDDRVGSFGPTSCKDQYNSTVMTIGKDRLKVELYLSFYRRVILGVKKVSGG